MVQYAPAPLARERKPQPTLEEIQTSRKIAEAMMREGSSYEPVGHWTQGAARVLQALSGSMGNAQANRQQKGLEGDANEALMGLYQPPSVTGGMPPIPSSAMQSEPPMSQEEASVGRFANPNVAPSLVAQAMAGGNAPASVRFNNPGAQYPGQSAQRFGTTGTETIGGGHKIAKFDSPVQGAAAQFDLLSRKYAGMPLAAAITKWSGGNSSPQYVAAISKATGLSSDTVLTPQMLSDPRVAVPLAKTMAQWEAGRPYPMDDNQWSEAHRMALGGPQQAAQPQPQQMPMQMADASQGQGMTRETLQRLLANPMTREFGQKMLLQEQQRNQPMSEKDRLDLEYRSAQINDLQNKQRLDQDRTRQIEALGLDPNSPEALAIQANGKLPAKAYELLKAKEMRSEAAAKISAGLSNLNKTTTKYNDAAFESSVGPIQGAAPDGYLNSIPINAARLLGEIGNNISGGNSSPTEVRSDIASSTEALAAAIKPLIRGPGEGPWTDADQARLVAIVGDLSTSRDKSEFKRRLNNVRDSLTSNFNMNIPFDAMGGTQPQAQGGQSDGWQTLPNGVRIREKR